MSFKVSLTGMNAALAELGVRSNNIANSATTGYKKSSAHFAALVADSIGAESAASVGRGSALTHYSRNFSQGSLQTTGNALDLAIEGDGFFVVQSNAASPDDPKRLQDLYTRNGSFRVNGDGYVVDGSGRPLKTAAGTLANQGLVRIPSAVGLPRASSKIALDVNLAADAAVKPLTDKTPFDPLDPTSFNHSTSVSVYDSQGNPRTAAIYFRKTALGTPEDPRNRWETYLVVDGKKLEPADGNTLSFDSVGRLLSPNGALKFKPLDLGGAKDKIDPLVLTLELDRKTSQYSQDFSIRGAAQDGYGPGLVQQLSIDNNGVVKAALTNGRSVDVATIKTARFRNPSALEPQGDGMFIATSDSGAATSGTPGAAGYGAIRGGALERSNVDMTEELIAPVSTQRNFSANAKAIQAVSDMEKNIADNA